MAGHFKQARRRVARRATVAGFGALSFALLAGILSFGLTTAYAGDSSENVAKYLPSSGRITELRNLSAVRPRVVAASRVLVDPNSRAVDLARVTDATPEPTPEPTEAQQVAMVLAAAASPPAAPAALAPGDLVQATVSFYYCEVGPGGLHVGDGGGFCGIMRNGDVVFSGAAACAYEFLGQRFRIVGDPTQRVYICADTGSAVLGMHRDIWFMDSDDGWDWQLDVGQVATIEILP